MTMAYIPEIKAQDSEQMQKAEVIKNKFTEYLGTLEIRGLLRRTRSGMGYSRNVAEKTYFEFLKDVPEMEESDLGVYKCTYETEADVEDKTRYLLVVMDYADPVEATKALIKAGLPSPKQLKTQIEEASGLFDY